MLIKNVVSKITFFNNIKLSYRTLSVSAAFKEHKVHIGDWNINYLIAGHGPHKVLLIPGALGSIWTDFKPQVEGFNRDKFTVVAWDPPGYGKSRPPERDFTTDFYEKDAQIAYEFMKALKIPKYSILGWSDGAVVSMILAAKYPEAVNKMVVWGANSFILPTELEAYQKTKDVNTWSQKMKQPMIDLYGEELLAKYWIKWNEGLEAIYNAYNGDVCSKLLKDIRCPTLIIHGEKDPMVDNVHASHLHTNIEGSRIHLYPEGKHNVHLRYSEDFNERVQKFLELPVSKM